MDIDNFDDIPAFAFGVGKSKQGDLKLNILDIISTADDRYNVAEPSTPTHPSYPYNKAEQTMSGHLFEVDDTPGAERLLRMHKSGTFEEIHPDGKRVTKIYGDDFYIVLDDHTLVVGGNLNITVQGNANLLVKGDMKTKVDGNYSLVVNGDMTTRVKGKIKVFSAGDLTLQTKAVFSSKSLGRTHISSDSTLDVTASNTLHVSSEATSYLSGNPLRFNSASRPSIPSNKLLDPTSGLTVEDSVTSPPMKNLKVLRINSTSMLDLLDDGTTPKDRIKDT